MVAPKMATSLAADKPNLPAPGDGANDPFVTSTPVKHRFSTFDHDLFAVGPASSPRQAKRALEAHLAETERRLEEAGKLGTALVSQRKALTEQLQEVEKLKAEGELNPELRRKLVDIEREYNDLARESARAFLPKQRVPSNEANPNSPFAPEGRSGRRSVSPSKFESQATGSPTKLSVPNRKIRNQPSNRVHDIEFAAEISTSLIAQVRNLQALLAERDEEVKDLKYDKSKLEIESENFQQRVKALDESEHRYKEENWNLETRLQELSTQQKEAADREKKLTQSLNVLKAEKVSAQKELDEVKLSYSKLTEEHSAAVKHLDIELGTAKRNMAMADGERAAMQRKIDDLTSQNQELAKAFSTQRGRALEREYIVGSSDDDREVGADHVTPEHSPPPSPIKGTPRHSMLETETMKSSLHHAQRTIQSQRSLLHREKTEKLELKRIIQDLRDDLEKTRTDSSGSNSNRRSRKADSKEFKRTPRLLGSFRSSRQEVVHDDPDWEDQHDLSPRTSATVSPVIRQAGDFSMPADPSDHFDTANEASESAFETANERATETEDFQTVNEEFSGSDDAETETESVSRGFGRMKQTPSLPAGLARHGNRDSFHSTASTSADEDDFSYLRTPTATVSQRSSRFRLSRGPFSRSSRQQSEEPPFQSSPASFASSAGGTPQAGQSLFAELQDFEGSDEESVGGMTPSRRSIRSVTPGSFNRTAFPPVPPLPKVIMVDSGMMTDPVKFAPNLSAIDTSNRSERGLDESPPGSPVSVVARDRPMSMESAFDPSRDRLTPVWRSMHEEDGEHSRPLSMAYSDAGAQHDPDMEEKLAQFPAPPTMLAPILAPPPALSMSSISSEMIEPRKEVVIPPTLSMTSLSTESVEPRSEPEIPTPDLSLSSIIAEHLMPVIEPEPTPPALDFSHIVAENLEPLAEPETPPPALSLSTMLIESVEPKLEPVEPSPELTLTTILTEMVDPVAEPEVPAPLLSLSGLHLHSFEPVAEPPVEPVVFVPPPPALSLSTISREHVEPIAPRVPSLALSSISREHIEPIAPQQPNLGLSGILAEELEPIAEPEPVVAPIIPLLPVLGLSNLSMEHVEPVQHPEPEAPQLSLSSISGQQLEPIPEPEVQAIVPELCISSISTEHVEPSELAAPELTMSTVSIQHVAPIAEPEILPPIPELTISSILGEQVEPVSIEPPTLAISSISMQGVEPVVAPMPSLAVSTIYAEHVEPREVPSIVPLPTPLVFSNVFAEHVEPVSEPEPVLPTLALSSITTQHVQPAPEALPDLVLSTINAEGVEPISPVFEEPIVPDIGFSSIEFVETMPISPRSPRRDGFILPRDANSPFTENDGPRTPTRNIFGAGRGKYAETSPIIAEDETRQSPKDASESETPESQRPFKEISTNLNGRPARQPVVPTTDQGAQTSLTAEAIDELFKSRSRPAFAYEKSNSIMSFGSPATVGTTGTVRIRRSQESFGSPIRNKGKLADDFGSETGSIRRPGSSASAQISFQDPPPLPSNHRQVIEAARSNSAHGSISNMGPPLWPASALKQRPVTPSQRPMTPLSTRAAPTPRAGRSDMMHGSLEVQSPPKLSARSRQSSVSSFASELDTRFNMRPGDMGIDPAGFGPNTDPRMIQAITQTMIGEYLWKYTRKTGRGEMSGNRHRRYFWVHPYTRTLYWSDRDPSSAGRAELKAKSVPIEAVRVVTDDNPMPPGLHRKSLVIISPGRTIKFTCTTGQRHETWFNALSYLLLRTNAEGESDAEDMAESITREDIDEFNPQYGRQSVNSTRPRPPPSLSSYNSRTTRNESPAIDMSMNIPTLTPTPHKKSAQRPSLGSLSKLSGYWKSGTFSSRRSRAPSAQNLSIYEASEVHDSAEDLREIIERQDRESDRLENVRACCDGKHDVGTLHHHSKRGRSSNHTHSHPGSNSAQPKASVRSRA